MKSELSLINTSVTKDKLQRDYKKMENKLKTKNVEKKALQIKKTELEKKVLEITRGSGSDTLNKIISEKETKIQSLKKKLKLPHDSHVETTELKIDLEEKQNLESELQNTKAIVGIVQRHKEELEQQIQLLKGKVEKMSLTDPSFFITFELGELLVTKLELRNIQDELDKAKEDIFIKDNLLKESLASQEVLTQQVRSTKDILTQTKHAIWDCSLREIKKLKEHFIQIEVERQLATSFLSSLHVLYENLGDKPLQAQNAINFLNSKTKTQLQFEGIQDRTNLIAQAKKYITKEKCYRTLLPRKNTC